MGYCTDELWQCVSLSCYTFVTVTWVTTQRNCDSVPVSVVTLLSQLRQCCSWCNFHDNVCAVAFSLPLHADGRTASVLQLCQPPAITDFRHRPGQERCHWTELRPSLPVLHVSGHPLCPFYVFVLFTGWQKTARGSCFLFFCCTYLGFCSFRSPSQLFPISLKTYLFKQYFDQ